MGYALESRNETQRLEEQSKTEGYDFQKEFPEGLDLTGKTVCDAGCGSGIVARYLAGKFPSAKLLAIDASDIRVQQSKNLSRSFSNITFQREDITHLTLDDNSMDFIYSRYVIEHLTMKKRMHAIQDFYRCLSPGGQLCIIDMDGIYVNIHPVTKALESGIKKLRTEKSVDLYVGRKLPHVMAQCGFENLKWEVQAVSFSGQDLQKESQLIADRFKVGQPFFEKVLGSKRAFTSFQEEYMALLKQPGTTLFYNKWIVTGTKY